MKKLLLKSGAILSLIALLFSLMSVAEVNSTGRPFWGDVTNCRKYTDECCIMTECRTKTFVFWLEVADSGWQWTGSDCSGCL
jgi:hypothetical protein